MDPALPWTASDTLGRGRSRRAQDVKGWLGESPQVVRRDLLLTFPEVRNGSLLEFQAAANTVEVRKIRKSLYLRCFAALYRSKIAYLIFKIKTASADQANGTGASRNNFKVCRSQRTLFKALCQSPLPALVNLGLVLGKGHCTLSRSSHPRLYLA